MSAQPQPTTFDRKWFWLVCALFFASGLSSLIYQVAWTRHLVLIFGSTTLATSTVLAVFMGGLALGSFFAGRMTDKLQKPFLWYGILEGLIGAWALFVPILLATAVSTYRVVWELTHFDFFTFSLVRLAIASVILLFPTTLMGATLPLLSKFVTDSLANVGERVGTIYAINTLGAVAGAALTGFYLLPTIGLAQTTVTSASINMLLCLAVIFVSMKLERKAETQAQPVNESAPDATVEAVEEVPTRALSKIHLSKKKRRAASAAAAADALASKIEIEKRNSPETISTEKTAPEETAETAETAKIAADRRGLKKQLVLALLAIGVSGAAAMVYEVCWTRTLSMIIGGSTYAFTAMLTTFLAGIFAGGFVCAKFVDKIKRPFLAFGILQIMVAIGCLVSLILTRYLPEWNVFFNYILPLSPLNALAIRFVLAEAALLPVTIFLGALFPVVIKCCTSDLTSVGRSVGSVYSANTLGAIIGSLISGFLLIPNYGVEKTILIAVGTNLLAGAILIFSEREARVSTKIAYVAIGVVALCTFVVLPSDGNQKSFLLAQSARRAMRDGHNVLDKTQAWPRSMARATVVFFKDGPCSNVAVMKFPNGGDTSFALLTNGCVDASDGADMSQQVLLATYPYLFRPYARKACVIGWGSGVTVSSLLNFPIDSVTAVELEPAVIEAARVFHPYTHAPENDPRVKVEINDGRNFLLATTQKFDIIVSEPSNPWQVGVCNLFTQEYFECVKGRLSPDGVLSLWLQLSEVSPSSVKSVLAALRSQFKYCMAMSSDSSNLVLLASNQPLPLNFSNLEEAFKNPIVRRELEKTNIATPEAILSRMSLTPKGVNHLVEKVKPNQDDLNQLEYEIGKTYESVTFNGENILLLSENMGQPAKYVDWGKATREEISTRMSKVAMEAIKFGQIVGAYSWARASVEEKDNDVAKRVLKYLEEVEKRQLRNDRAQPLMTTPGRMQK